MIRISRRMFLGASAAALAMPLAVVGQETDADEILQNLPGLQTAYARRYAPADEGAAMQVADWPVEPTASTPRYLLVMMLTFSNAFVVQGLAGGMLTPDLAASVMGRSSDGLVSLTNQSLPKGNVLFAGTDEDAHVPYASLLVMPMRAMVYVVQTEGDSDQVQATADAIAGYIANQPAATGKVTVVREGVATGGPFTVLPGVDDAQLLNGLYPFNDYDLLVSDLPILPTESAAMASPAATPHADSVATIAMTNELRFDPEEIVIAVGTTVEWINTSEIEHTATGDPERNPAKRSKPDLVTLPEGAEPWGSELIPPGGTYRHTFTVAGEYRYICFPHALSGMEGTIVVEA